jgi:hypothetical protein
MTGWNLPPGVNESDIPGNRPEDWLMEAIAEGWRPRCEKCGGFLAIEPDDLEVQYEHCDGIPHKKEIQYNDGTHEGILDIIGEEYRDKSYTIYYFTNCDKFGWDESSEKHEPHSWPIPYSERVIRHCKKCGHKNSSWE